MGGHDRLLRPGVPGHGHGRLRPGARDPEPGRFRALPGHADASVPGLWGIQERLRCLLAATAGRDPRPVEPFRAVSPTFTVVFNRAWSICTRTRLSSGAARAP